jgi:molybdate transport system substrate-binding protein
LRTVARLAALAAASALLLSGCASIGDEDPNAPQTPAASVGPELTGELTVYAAASLKNAFDELATKFEERNPSLEVLPIVYDGSSTLATQLVEGAPADVFASADEANIQRLVDANLAVGPELFATNTLVIAMPQGNPGEVEDLGDLGDDSVTVVLCAPDVPCGAAAQTLLGNAGVPVSPASIEQSVTAVLTKIAANEADAGLVYATDVRGRDNVESLVPEGAADVVNRYPIVALSGAANPEAAAAFTAFVLSPEGQRVLAELGFGSP